MKYLWISKTGDTLGLAMKVAKEGNDVEFAILDPKRKTGGTGLIDRIDDWRAATSKDKIIVFDQTGQAKAAEALRKQGYNVFGGSLLGDAIELDRTYGSNFMTTAGIKVPKTETYTDFGKAIETVRRSRQKYVFKPNGNMNCALTYVAYNDEDMINFLENIQGGKFNKIEFELQCVQPGSEVSLEGLFNGEEWVDGFFNITMERKREMTGDLGHNTGCAVDVVKVLREQIESPMVKKTLARITPALKEARYKGVIDINCIYFNATPFGLEWTPRFGINAILTLNELIKDDLGKLIADVAMGNKFKANMRDHLFASSVMVNVPEKPKIPNRLLQNVTNFNHIWPMDVKISDHGDLVTADEDFSIAVVTESGPTIQDSVRKMYDVLRKTENFGILDVEYRTDCGNSAQEIYNSLTRWGLVK
jgi:phosphoribosylamine---glycine ligase